MAAEFLRNLIARVPCRIHSIWTDNGLQFPTAGEGAMFPVHDFGRVCRDNGIGHHLTKVGHPWTNGQVERMNRTIREATVKRYCCGSHDELRTHPNKFPDAYNFARRLKSLGGKTPWEEIIELVEKETGMLYNKTVD